MRHHTLYVLSAIYLLIPNIIYFIYWAKPVIAFIAIALTLYIVYKNKYRQNGFCKTYVDSKDLCIALISAITLTLVSGTGGFAFQTMDHWCHHAKFQDLLKNEWPLRFPAGRPVMAYYFGYYLVPAAFSKLSGHVSAIAIMTWTTAGIMLGLLWLYIALCRKWWAMLLVLCVGDFPRVFKGIAAYGSFPLYRYEAVGVEHWSNLENLFWAPNQFIPSIILGGMLFYVLRHRLDAALLCFPTALSLWWAAFPALVVGLLTALLLAAQWVRWGVSYRVFWEKVMLPLIIAMPVMLLFQSHPQPPENGFIWNFRSDAANLLREYLTNTIADVLLFVAAFLIFRRAGFTNAPAGPFWLLIGITLLFPLVRVGKVNDMLLRGMMPVLILTGCYLLYPLTREPWPKVVAALKGNALCVMVGLALLLQAVIGIGRFYRAARFNRITALWSPAHSKFMPLPYDAYPSLYETLRQRWSQQEAEQYLGKSGSFYEKYIAPPPE